MRILWLSHLVPYPPRSGVAQRSYGLLAELCKRHSVTLLAFHQRALFDSMCRDPRNEFRDAVEHLAKLCARVQVFDIPWERTRLSRYTLALYSLVHKHPYSINWLESEPFTRAVREELETGQDLVHFDTISLAPFRACVRDVPCVMNHHNVESHLLHRRARTSGSLARRAYDWQEAVRLARYEREVAPEFQLHVTCSELDKERLRHVAPGAESCVIPNGVDIEYFSPRRGGTLTPTFVFVGTLGWGPNRSAAEMIAKQLWPALANEWPRATMHLVGSNPPESARELAARDRRFIVTGFVDDVRPYMADASFFVCPIRDGGGTKLKILNAMSMQKVVIADPIACEGINAVTGAEVVLATTSDDYVRAVHSLLADPARYHAIAEAARQRVAREYSYEVIGRDMDRRYQAVREAFLSQR